MPSKEDLNQLEIELANAKTIETAKDIAEKSIAFARTLLEELGSKNQPSKPTFSNNPNWPDDGWGKS